MGPPVPDKQMPCSGGAAVLERGLEAFSVVALAVLEGLGFGFGIGFGLGGRTDVILGALRGFGAPRGSLTIQ